MNIAKFRNWLTNQGVEIIPSKYDYEVIVFKCCFGKGVIYGQDDINTYKVNSTFVNDAIHCYKNNIKWLGKNKTSKRKKVSKYKRYLLDRDGNNCFYCGASFIISDLTIEHVLSKVHGGTDKIENLVLSCLECNESAGILSVHEKIKFRDRKRLQTDNKKPLKVS